MRIPTQCSGDCDGDCDGFRGNYDVGSITIGGETYPFYRSELALIE